MVRMADQVVAKHDRRLWTLALLYSAGLTIHVVRVGGDFMGQHRFLVPILPILAIAVAQPLRAVHQSLRSRVSATTHRSLYGTLALLVLLHLYSVDRRALAAENDFGVDRIGLLKQFSRQWTAIGQWIRDNSAEDVRLATTAAGAIPYYSRRYTYDLLLLNVDTDIVLQTPPTTSRPGHSREAQIEQALAQGIDLFISHPTISDTPPAPAAELAGYEWVTIRVPGLKPAWWGVLRRIEPATEPPPV